LKLLDLTLASPAANLALDEALLLEAEDAGGPEVLRFWESAVPAVVLGAGGSVAIDVNRAACDADGVPILRRSSGGGTVLLGPGCLGYSLILRTDREPGLHLIQPATRFVMNRMLGAIRDLVPDAVVEGVSDLARNGRKFSGSAQQRKRSHFLHHGTLLYDFDLSLIPRYLNAPERQPEYRRGRGHDEFLTNLPATAAELKRRLIQEWGAVDALTEIPFTLAGRLTLDKYERDDWNFRR
jgi:lipoate-protein ligase A